jgi:tetratricopeptide (TPR) repeat protein
MEKTFLLLTFLLSNLLYAQGDYDQGMKQAFQLWEDGNNNEASALFERIASAEKDNWLPNYYVALINTTSAFQTKDGKEVEILLSKAQTALDKELNKNPENPELLVLQAMIHTARIAYDPMTNGQTLSGKVMSLYQKAETIAPENPRVILSKAQFELGSARFFGTDTTPICAQIRNSIILFDNFNPDSPFHPKWGKKQAEENLEACGKS